MAHSKPARFLDLAALFFWVVLSSIRVCAQSPGQALRDAGVEARVEALVKQMTLEEKVGQVIQRDAGGSLTGPGRGGSGWDSMAARGEFGSLFNLTNPPWINAVQRAAVERSRLRIPVLFGLDVIHGFRTTFPVPLGMAATWDPSLVERAARVAAEEASATGIRWTFSPMVDIARDARWGRIVEGAGEDPYLGAAMARAYVVGYEGARLDASDSIAACAKHYVGYGAAEGGRDYNTVDMSERTLRQVYLPPFKAAVDAGAATLMSAFNSLNEVPTSANAFTLTRVLRDEWKFRGFVVSDYDAINELIQHGIANDARTAARKAFLAGVDMDMEDGLYGNLVELVRSGAVPEATMDEAVRRILRVKYALGLFDRPYVQEAPRSAGIKAEHRELARQAAEESFVLLKNDPARNGAPALPISEGARTIALVGPLADSARDMLGSWSTSASRPEDVVTLRAALTARCRERHLNLLYAPGTTVSGQSESGFREAVNVARQADVVLMALGEEGTMSGEANSRTRLDLPGNQEQLLTAVAGAGKPVVVVLFSGRPLALTSTLPHMSALLEVWFPGIEAGPAIVRTLFGDAAPSGRLTVSFPRTVGQEPLYYNALNTGRPAEGLDLTHPPRNAAERYHSRYIDELNAPLFPFGYGLSYTRFAYSPVTLSATRVSARTLNSQNGASLRVSAEVKNTGNRAGEEVVQLYIRERGTSVARPVRELKGFKRVALGPGESRRVEFTLGRDELAFWNIDMQNAVEPAAVTVWIGPSSAEGPQAQFEITE